MGIKDRITKLLDSRFSKKLNLGIKNTSLAEVECNRTKITQTAGLIL